MNGLSLLATILVMVAAFFTGMIKFLPAIVFLLFGIFITLIQLHVQLKKMYGTQVKLLLSIDKTP